MKNDLLVLRLGSGTLALFLFLFPPVLGAEDAAAEKSPKANAKSDVAKDGTATAGGNAAVQEQAASESMAAEEKRLKLTLAKYDANRDGQLDDAEKKSMDADLALWAKKYKQALAKYDANKNGVLDQDEKAKMKKDEALPDRHDRKVWSDMEKIQQRSQQRLRAVPSRNIALPPRP